MKERLDRFFSVGRRGSSLSTEILAGLATFLSMAYIVVANPQILEKAGMERSDVFVATCLSAALASLLMGLWANLPIALAPGMGINAYFAFELAPRDDWRTALGVVFVSGVIFLALSLLPVRRWILDGIPLSLKRAIAAGVGLFLFLLGLKQAGIVVDHEDTLVALGDLSSWPAAICLATLCLMVVLSGRKVPGAVILAIAAGSFMGLALGASEWKGWAEMPSLPGTFLELDWRGALEPSLLPAILALLIVDLFDSSGTLVGVSHQAGLLDKDGRLPRIKRAFLADSTGTVAGALVGTSTVTSYIESAAGTAAGGRTGMVPVTVAALFLGCLFLGPLAASVPEFAVAPALLFVGCLMMRSLSQIDWDDIFELVPVAMLALAIPLSFSITDGIGIGFLCWVGIRLLALRFREIHPAAAAIALLFLAKFAWLD